MRFDYYDSPRDYNMQILFVVVLFVIVVSILFFANRKHKLDVFHQEINRLVIRRESLSTRSSHLEETLMINDDITKEELERITLEIATIKREISRINTMIHDMTKNN